MLVEGAQASSQVLPMRSGPRSHRCNFQLILGLARFLGSRTKPEESLHSRTGPMRAHERRVRSGEGARSNLG